MTIMEQLKRVQANRPSSPYEALEAARREMMERQNSDDMPKFKLSSEVRIKK